MNVKTWRNLKYIFLLEKNNIIQEERKYTCVYTVEKRRKTFIDFAVRKYASDLLKFKKTTCHGCGLEEISCNKKKSYCFQYFSKRGRGFIVPSFYSPEQCFLVSIWADTVELILTIYTQSIVHLF